MSDKEDVLEDLFFDSNCKTSDNISIGSSNRAVSTVQENQPYATKKSKLVHRQKYAKFNDQADGQKLKKLLLLSYESYYATLSIIYPLIEALKFIFAEFKILNDAQDDEQTTPNYKQTTSIYTTSLNSNNICHNRLHSSIFDMSTSTYTASNLLAKLKCYLDPTQTPITKDI
ncbi:13716_t:CDS:2, partial [Cetraspora pellucida]